MRYGDSMHDESAGASPLGRGCRTVAERSVTANARDAGDAQGCRGPGRRASRHGVTRPQPGDAAPRPRGHRPPGAAGRGVPRLPPEPGSAEPADAALGNTDGDTERERMIFEQMRARHVDGLVLATAHLNDPLLAESARAELPVVLMNRLAHDYSLPSVSVDNERGVHLAVAHLAGLGHQRIAHIAGPQEVSTGLARYRGFVAAMEANGLQPDAELVIAARAFSVEEGLRCARVLLERGHALAGGGCTAVVAANDMLALGCYAALDEAGLSCPEDLSVVGFNDMPFIDRLRPPLTTIRFPHYQVGREAAQLLLERIAGHTGPVKILFLAPELVVRGSTAAYGPPARPTAKLGALRQPPLP